MDTDPRSPDEAASGWTEVAGGIFVLLWGIAGIAGLLWRPSIWQDDYGLDPGPGLMPILVIACLVLGGLAMAAYGALRVARGRGGDSWAGIRAESEPVLIAGAFLLSVLAYVVALKVVGFLIATPVFATAWIAVVDIRDGARDPVRTLAVAALAAVLIAVAVYIVFQRLIGVLLP